MWKNVLPRTAEIVVDGARINHGKVVVVDEPNGHVVNTVKSTMTPSSLYATVANRDREYAQVRPIRVKWAGPSNFSGPAL